MLLSLIFILRIIKNFRNLHRTIKLKYGRNTIVALRRIEKSREKLCKLELDIKFLQRCQDNQLFPNFLLKYKLPVRRLQGSDFHRREQKKILLDELSHKRNELRRLRQEALTRPNVDGLGLSWLDRVRVRRSLARSLENFSTSVQRTHHDKLMRLGYNELKHPTPDSVIFNFSNRTFNDDEKDVLALGLEFAINSRKVLATEFFLPFEKLLTSSTPWMPSYSPVRSAAISLRT